MDTFNIGLREAYAVGMRKAFQISGIIMLIAAILVTIPANLSKYKKI